MVSKKDRRHSGYVSSRATICKAHLVENDLFIEEFYDDWKNYRDGFRDWFRDFKKIKKLQGKQWHWLFDKRMQMNKKQKKLLKRRAAKSKLTEADAEAIGKKIKSGLHKRYYA